MSAPAPSPDARARLAASPLFDAHWYVARNPDAADDPVGHYLRHGRADGPDPGPRFSAAYHAEAHGLTGAANPLLHHLDGPPPPDPAGLLEAAWRHGRDPGHAMALARAALPANLAHTARIFGATLAARAGDDAAWLRHMAAYLAPSGMAPLTLMSDGASVFDRLSTAPIAPVTDGPKISVLMAAHNVESSVETAIRSILDQSWQNLELIAIDDASTDGTAARLMALADSDPRLIVRVNRVNVGPYVTKNIALGLSSGAWITGQDADDWAHPQRLERHMRAVRARSDIPASQHAMLRMTADGQFPQIRPIGGESHDGVLQVCPVSMLLARELLVGRLGAWDSARFGADAELRARVTRLLGRAPPRLPIPAMMALDRPGSLTNNPETGIHPDFGVTAGRQAYRAAWRAWHRDPAHADDLHCAFPPDGRRYALPAIAAVPLADIEANLPPGPQA